MTMFIFQLPLPTRPEPIFYYKQGDLAYYSIIIANGGNYNEYTLFACKGKHHNGKIINNKTSHPVVVIWIPFQIRTRSLVPGSCNKVDEVSRHINMNTD
jgi:hypothetical protein